MDDGFTLIELLVVIAISALLIGMAIIGSSSVQAEQILNSSASNLISNINLMRNDAISGTTSFSNFSDKATNGSFQNWVYGFYIMPAQSSNNSFCNSNICSGYDMGLIQKNISSSNCLDSNPVYLPPSFGTFSALDLKNCATTTFPPSSSINSVYFHNLNFHVSISFCDPASGTTCNNSTNSFPIFQEITGKIFLFNEFGLYSSNSDTTFYLIYQNYYIPITFDQATNSFTEGSINNV